MVRVDFGAFERAVQAVEGITINVDDSFTDCDYPVEGQENNPDYSLRFKCVSFKKGLQTMNPEQALEFVRSRHAFGNEGSDLARAKRQQKVIMAIRDKALTVQTLTNPRRIMDLINSVGNSVQTEGIDFSQLGEFYALAQGVDSNKVRNVVLSDSDQYSPKDSVLLKVGDPNLYGGAFVFIPKAGEGNFKEIQNYVHSQLATANIDIQASPTALPEAP